MESNEKRAFFCMNTQKTIHRRVEFGIVTHLNESKKKNAEENMTFVVRTHIFFMNFNK